MSTDIFSTEEIRGGCYDPLFSTNIERNLNTSSNPDEAGRNIISGCVSQLEIQQTARRSNEVNINASPPRPCMIPDQNFNITSGFETADRLNLNISN